MVAPQSTLWDLEAHSAAKHEILRRYLAAWIPILSHGNFDEILYLDAFAGPGHYATGEDGSPIISLKELSGHGTKIAAKAHFHFVEFDPDRADFLEALVADLVGQLERERPGKTKATVHRNAFEEAYPSIKQNFRYGRLPATFAFIDAFGWTGLESQTLDC